MQLVKMFGPSISDPSKTVNRDVPKCDVDAYKRAGYQEGSIKEEVAVVVESAERPLDKYDEGFVKPKKGKK